MVAEWRDFTLVTKLIKNFTSLYGFGGQCFYIRNVCMDFEPCFKVYNLVSIRPKSMKLGQVTNLNVVFHMVGSVYRLVTIRNSPQFPVEFRNGLCCCTSFVNNVIICFHRFDPFAISSNLNASLNFVSGNIEILGKQNSLFPSGPVI